MQVSGTARGQIQILQQQGQYCDIPAGQPGDKNGAGNQTCDQWSLYTENEFNTWVPAPLTIVYVENQNSSQIGSCSTDIYGSYSCGWVADPQPTQIRVRWRMEDGFNRFKIRNPDGTIQAGYISSWKVPVLNGFTDFTAIQVNSAWGNLYSGAAKAWYNALNYSSILQNNYTGLQIWAFTGTNVCPTGCADGPNNRIKINSDSGTFNSAYAPQARIMHEMGHIASFKAQPRELTHGSYCYPLQEVAPSGATTCSDGTPNGWTLTSSEWQSIALEEGRASFFGDVAFYWHTAADARTCGVTRGTCSSSWKLETTATCSTNFGRRAFQADRYMWDIYDTASDGETVSTSYANFFTTINQTPFGFDWGESKSFYDPLLFTIDAWDSFSPIEWHTNMGNILGVNTTLPYNNNCMGWV